MELSTDSCSAKSQSALALKGFDVAHVSTERALSPDPRVCGAAATAEDFVRYLSLQKPVRKTSNGLFAFRPSGECASTPRSRPAQRTLDFGEHFTGKMHVTGRHSDAPQPGTSFATHQPKLEETYHYDRHAAEHTIKSVGPTFIDLFCGAGGLSLGLEAAGLRPVLAIDHEPWSVHTYKFNRPWLKEDCAIQGDVSRINPHHYLDANVDCLCAGIPCQPFSNANQQRQKGDSRLSLYEQFMRWAKVLRPPAILVENVTGFTSVSEDFVSGLSALGYSVSHCVVDAADFGVPQSRRRLIYLACRNDGRLPARKQSVLADLLLPFATNERFVLGHALEGLPELSANPNRNQPEYESPTCGFGARRNHMTHACNSYLARINRFGYNGLLYNHKARFNNARDVEIFSLLTPGEDSTAESIKHIMPYTRRRHIFKDKYYRLRSDRLSRTITSHMRYDCNTYIHPEQARGLTAREAARIQSFPDAYVFCGTFQRVYQQIGNAVPPMLAEAIGQAVRVLIQK